MSRLIPLIACLLLISSCSVKTLYNYSDFIMVRYANSLVSVDEPLYTDLKTASKRLLEWHRSTQLESYSQWLDSLYEATAHSLTLQQVTDYADQVSRLYAVTARQLYSELSGLMPLMNQDEVDALSKSFEDDNQKFYEKYVAITPKKRTEQYSDNMLEQFEEYIGTLSATQKKIITSASSALNHTSKERYIHRLAFQRKVIKILRSDDSAEVKQKQLSVFLNRCLTCHQLMSVSNKTRKLSLRRLLMS